MAAIPIFLLFFVAFASANAEEICGQKKVDYPKNPEMKHTVPGEIPWQARILNKFGSDNSWHSLCGGTLINDLWIITAAHCFNLTNGGPRVEYLRVQVGDPRTKDDVVVISVEEVRIYPGYDIGKFKKIKGDLALVKLKSPVNKPNLTPVCLPLLDEDFRGSTDCFSSGWGYVSPDILVETGSVMLQEDLKDEWNSMLGAIKVIRDSHIGFRHNSFIEGNHNMDSGGPIVCRHKTDKESWSLVGVVSFGENFGELRPVVLTEVSKYIEWIEFSMKYENIQTCGVQPPREKKFILGGTDTLPGEIPWQLAIVHSLSNIISHGKDPKLRTCGATLIKKDWVLTAAHCFDLGGGKLISNATYWQVRGGDWSRDAKDETEVDIDVEKIFGHPDYEVSPFGVEHDITLLKLKKPFDIEDTYESVRNTGIGLACLPKQNADYRETRHCIISGFGHLGYDIVDKNSSSSGSNSSKEELIPIHTKVMQRAVGNVWNQKELKKVWNPLGGLIKLVEADMIGFGMDRSHPYGACTGDSGGPLVCPTMTGNPPDWPYLWPQYTIVGVVSFGDPKCNKKPTVLSEVSKYRQWIETTIFQEDFKGVKKPDFEA